MFTCLSGSKAGNGGQLIGVDGQSIAHRLGNLTSYRMPPTKQGVYTCRMPDETGTAAEISFGLYPANYNGNYLLFMDFTHAKILRNILS